MEHTLLLCVSTSTLKLQSKKNIIFIVSINFLPKINPNAEFTLVTVLMSVTDILRSLNISRKSKVKPCIIGTTMICKQKEKNENIVIFMHNVIKKHKFISLLQATTIIVVLYFF